MAKKLASHSPGPTTMAFVVRVDSLNRTKDFFHGRKPKQASPGRQDIAKPSLLGNHRPSRGQIRNRAITEPAAAQPHILPFGNRKLSARVADVLSVRIEITGKIQSVTHSPAFAFQPTLIGFIVTAQRQLKGLARTTRQIDELLKFQMFAPMIDLAFKREFTPGLPPIPNRGKRSSITLPKIFPQIHYHWLARRMEFEPFGH